MLELPKLLYRKISKPFVWDCCKVNLTGVRLTLLNHVITLTFGCYFFATAQWWHALVICLINGFLDYLDGDVARAMKQSSPFGEWLDTGFDVVIQNAVMGAVGLGCIKEGLPVWWVVLFFIGNASNNFVSFYYNHKFGFHSLTGNILFRNLMDRKCHPVNQVLKNMIDPTGNFPSLAFYTYRYWVAVGCLFGIMPACFIAITVINNAKWALMYAIYSLYLMGEDRLFVLKALSALDEEKDDYYALRSG